MSESEIRKPEGKKQFIALAALFTIFFVAVTMINSPDLWIGFLLTRELSIFAGIIIIVTIITGILLGRKWFRQATRSRPIEPTKQDGFAAALIGGGVTFGALLFLGIIIGSYTYQIFVLQQQVNAINAGIGWIAFGLFCLAFVISLAVGNIIF